VNRLIKCTNSFLIGMYLAFVIMMGITGWVITKEFVSKTSLKTNIVYIDGVVYEVKEKRN
jgi:hypothetical protein